MKTRHFMPTIIISGLLFFSSCLKDEPFKLEYNDFVPQNIEDEWIISTPEEENIETERLETAYRIIYEDNRYRLIRSLLIIRNGKLVAEAYPHSLNDMHQLQNIQPATKAITSILTGIAFKNQLFDSGNPFLLLQKNIYLNHWELQIGCGNQQKKEPRLERLVYF